MTLLRGLQDRALRLAGQLPQADDAAIDQLVEVGLAMDEGSGV